jgi:hypothetical protein
MFHHVHIRKLTAESVALHRFCADASDLGLRPGQWPTVLVLEGYPYPIRHELALVATSIDGTRTYASRNDALRVRIFND